MNTPSHNALERLRALDPARSVPHTPAPEDTLARILADRSPSRRSRRVRPGVAATVARAAVAGIAVAVAAVLTGVHFGSDVSTALAARAYAATTPANGILYVRWSVENRVTSPYATYRTPAPNVPRR